MKINDIVTVLIGASHVPAIITELKSIDKITLNIDTSRLNGFTDNITVDFSHRKDGSWRRVGCQFDWTILGDIK